MLAGCGDPANEEEHRTIFPKVVSFALARWKESQIGGHDELVHGDGVVIISRYLCMYFSFSCLLSSSCSSYHPHQQTKFPFAL
jgi:hypothetical protein